jgi:hypothetical protein
MLRVALYVGYGGCHVFPLMLKNANTLLARQWADRPYHLRPTEVQQETLIAEIPNISLLGAP